MRHFLIDTDTASDDAVALIMAAKNPEVQVEAITVVAGNVPVEQAVQNALYTLELCKVQIPVYQGAAKPMLRGLGTAQFFHGKDGLGDIGLDLKGRKASEGNAIDVIVDTINKFAGEIELVTIGPLTNIAIALLKEPDLASKVKQCVVMGGIGQGPGNITPTAEYNIWVDPEAAKIVFSSGMKIKMVGWDVSFNYAFFDDEAIAEMKAINTPLAHFAVDIQRKGYEYAEKGPDQPGFDLPDPIAMAVALDPTVVKKSIVRKVEIICSNDLGRGQTVIDHRNILETGNEIEVVLETDVDRFRKILFQALN